MHAIELYYIYYLATYYYLFPEYNLENIYIEIEMETGSIR